MQKQGHPLALPSPCSASGAGMRMELHVHRWKKSSRGEAQAGGHQGREERKSVRPLRGGEPLLGQRAGTVKQPRRIGGDGGGGGGGGGGVMG